MADSKPIRKCSLTNRAKCRLTAMRKKKALLKNTYPLYEGNELVVHIMSQVSPDKEAELKGKMAAALPTGGVVTKRWDVLFDAMANDASLINLLWDLIVLKNVGNRDIKVPLLEEYRKDIKQKCQKDLEHLRLSSRNKTEVGNYLLLRLDEYQFDLSNVSAELDGIDDCVEEIWATLGRSSEVSGSVLPQTENVGEIIQKLREVLQEMSAGIKECRNKDQATNIERIKELETSMEEIKESLRYAEYKEGVLQRQNGKLEYDNDRLKMETSQYSERTHQLQRRVTELELEKAKQQQDEDESKKLLDSKDHKIKQQQEHINALASANKCMTEENKALHNQKQDLEDLYKNTLHNMNTFFEERISQMTTSAEHIMAKVQEASLQSIAYANQRVSNAQNNTANNQMARRTAPATPNKNASGMAQQAVPIHKLTL